MLWSWRDAEMITVVITNMMWIGLSGKLLASKFTMKGAHKSPGMRMAS
jgi:hypothetical protein